MSEKFSLKWNDFQSNITSAFRQFQTKTNFQDVTLASNDLKQISAHRVVLSAGSGYFNNLLSQNSHSHPLLCLDGIKFSELNNVLDFIYTGELQINQEDLDRFLQIAQRLQLQGLHEVKENFQANFKTEDFSLQVKDNIEIATTFETKVTETDSMNFLTEQPPEKKVICMNSDDFQRIEDLDIYIEQQILKTEGGHKCDICNYESSKKCHIKDHMETHINGLTFECNFCGITKGTRTALRHHKKRHS